MDARRRFRFDQLISADEDRLAEPPAEPRDPSPDEIRRACLRIRTRWPAGERRIRARFRPPFVDMLASRDVEFER